MSRPNDSALSKRRPLRLLIPLLPIIGGALWLGVPDTASAAVQNVTLNKPVTSSGYMDPYEPTRAVDGSLQPTSRWYQAATGDKWIQVDLGDVYSLSSWHVTGMGIYYEWSDGLDPYDFHLETSLDGASWQSVDTVKGNTDPMFQRSLSSVPARYVKLVIDKGNSSNNQWASVLEFEAYGELLNVPAAPANVTGVYQNGGVTLNWDSVSQAASYTVSRNGTPIYSGPLNSFTDNGPLQTGEITYLVQAVNAKGTGTGTEIKVHIPTDEELANAAAAALELGLAAGDSSSSVTQDLSLPVSGLNGASVSWSSSAPGTVGSDGTIIRPAYDKGDQSVSLTATVSVGSAKVTREFTVLVLRETADTAITRAAQELDLGDLSAVATNLALPDVAYGGTLIEWSSSAPDIVSVSGTVHRPSYTDGGRDVTLTAILRLDGLERTRTFIAHIAALPISDMEAVTAVYKSLVLPVTTVTYDLDLPVSGANEVHIVWSSSRPDLLDSSGRVTLPSYTQGDQTVTLDATVTRGTYSLTKPFTLLLPALPITPEEAVRLAAGLLMLNDPDGIKDSITLPQSGAFDTDIRWSSDRPEVLDIDGRVNRPRYTEGDAVVHLTAVLTKDSVSVQRTFTFTVLKALPNLPYIRLNGTSPILLESGDSFADPGASVVDSVYGSILADGLTGTGRVDVNTPGTYTLEYAYSAEGWSAEPAQREVQVRPRRVTAAAGSSPAGSVIVTGSVPGARLELYNLRQERVSVGTASATGEYEFTPVPEETGYYAVQVVNGLSSSPSVLVYAWIVSAEEVAASITSIPNPGVSDTFIQLPEVPDGFKVGISSSSHPEIVQTDGTIRHPSSDTPVTIVLEVVRDSDGARALTQPISISIPGVSSGNGGGPSGNPLDLPVLLQSVLLEQGRTVIVYTPSSAYLDQQINSAGSGGSPYAQIILTGEKDVSRVVLPADALVKFDTIGISILSNHALVRFPAETLRRLSASGNELVVSIGPDNTAAPGALSLLADEQKMRLSGTAVSIEIPADAAPGSVILPLSGDRLPAATGPTNAALYVLAQYPDGTTAVIPASIVKDGADNAVGALIEISGSGTFAPAVPVSGSDGSVGQDSGSEPVPSWIDAKNHWASDALDSLAARGWLQGYGDGTVRPDRQVTRAEFVSLVAKALGLETETAENPAFADLDGHWAASAVQSAYDQGWINGVSPNTFGPDTGLTREQAIVILVNAVGAVGARANVPGRNLDGSFTDGNHTADWAISAVQQALESGWIVGYPDGTLKPDGGITRAEAAELLLRALGPQS